MKNGIVDLRKATRGSKAACRPHTAAFVSTASVPFAFDLKARAHRWLVFLQEVLPEDQSRKLLQEIFGYCLTYHTNLQKFFLFEGRGGNGKGVVLNILTRLLGPHSISSVPLERFNSPHDLVATLGKRANITADSGEVDKLAEGLLKQFTGEDMMHFNPKYREGFNARPTAKLIIATNVFPTFRDRSNGLWRRLIHVEFPVTIPERKQNHHLVEELSLELGGIFNWALQGLARLKKRGHFIEPVSARQRREAFQRESNPARQFLEEYCTPKPKSQVGRQELYDRYCKFCQMKRCKPLSDDKFARDVFAQFPSVAETRPRLEGGKRPRQYKGLQFMEEGCVPPCIDLVA
jgi:putative DNA primase/helicase